MLPIFFLSGSLGLHVNMQKQHEMLRNRRRTHLFTQLGIMVNIENPPPHYCSLCPNNHFAFDLIFVTISSIAFLNSSQLRGSLSLVEPRDARASLSKEKILRCQLLEGI